MSTGLRRYPCGLSASALFVFCTSLIRAFDALAQLDSMFEIAESEPTFPTNTELLDFDLKERPRILVVDDATIIHKTIKGYLDSKYEVATAINGNIALRFLKTGYLVIHNMSPIKILKYL